MDIDICRILQQIFLTKLGTQQVQKHQAQPQDHSPALHSSIPAAVGGCLALGKWDSGKNGGVSGKNKGIPRSSF